MRSGYHVFGDDPEDLWPAACAWWREHEMPIRLQASYSMAAGTTCYASATSPIAPTMPSNHISTSPSGGTPSHRWSTPSRLRP
ncbi:MAG: hypothetical protein ACI8PZ_004107 [Myxococcota bacterium]|jgi:hypothetical protein